MTEKALWQRGFDWIAQQIGEAATDIRRRVVEEGWFGKPQDGPMARVDAPSPTAPESAWDWTPDPRATAALREPGPDMSPEPPSPAPAERGMDF